MRYNKYREIDKEKEIYKEGHRETCREIQRNREEDEKVYINT